MNFIFITDNKGGMSLFGRRLSKDAALRAKICETISKQDGVLYMNSYSAKQFADEEIPCNYVITENYLDEADGNSWCLVETGMYSVEMADKILLCNWNRDYPADRFLCANLESSGFSAVETCDIPGKSHDRITLTLFAR